MSESWVKSSEQILKGLREAASKKGRDRLEVVNSILFSLNALERSVNGWKMWIRNLSLMSQFTLEELGEIEKALHSQAESIIEYDLKATKKWKDKFPVFRVARERRAGRGESQGFSV